MFIRKGQTEAWMYRQPDKIMALATARSIIMLQTHQDSPNLDWTNRETVKDCFRFVKALFYL